MVLTHGVDCCCLAFALHCLQRKTLMSAVESMKDVGTDMLKTNEPHMMNLLYAFEDLVDLFSTFFDGRIILHETRNAGNRNKDSMLTALSEWPTNAFLSVVRVMTGLMSSDQDMGVGQNMGARHGMLMTLPPSKMGFGRKCAARLHFRKRRRRFAAISGVGGSVDVKGKGSEEGWGERRGDRGGGDGERREGREERD